MKLAIIDDDEISVFIAKKAIEKFNFVEVSNVFENGLDAFNFIKKNLGHLELLPDIILLDLFMPVMDGWQFLEKYTKLNPKIGKTITIHICSSSFSPCDIIKASNIGTVSDYIIKPISKENLMKIMEQSQLNDLNAAC